MNKTDGHLEAIELAPSRSSSRTWAFGQARVRAYGYPGRRQTRWIKGRHQLTTDEIRNGTRFEDAVARTAWPIELHDRVPAVTDTDGGRAGPRS